MTSWSSLPPENQLAIQCTRRPLASTSGVQHPSRPHADHRFRVDATTTTAPRLATSFDLWRFAHVTRAHAAAFAADPNLQHSAVAFLGNALIAAHQDLAWQHHEH